MDDDLIINKQGAIEALQAYCDMNCEYTKQQRDLCCGSCKMGDAIDIVDSLPSVQPKTARWIRHFPVVGKDFECSECGGVVMTAFECFKDGCYYDYCPNCGAKMER